MKKYLQILSCGLICLLFASFSLVLTASEIYASNDEIVRHVAIPKETKHHFNLATQYKYERRYELARQHLLLALATCNTTQLRDFFQRQLQAIDLQIRTLR